MVGEVGGVARSPIDFWRSTAYVGRFGMYVGHALLGFVLGALLATRFDASRGRVLAIGVLAGGFAALPDVDLVYTLYAVVQAWPTTIFPTPRHVWTAEAWRVHRALTHSVVVAAVASAGVAALALARDRDRLSRRLPASGVGILALGWVLWVGTAADGVAGLVTAGLYVVGALLLLAWATRRAIPPTWLGTAAAVGLLTHPFGDLFMGRPPAFLFPLSAAQPIPTLAVAPDPTVNLLALFGLEVALAWAAVATVAAHRGWSIREAMEPQAVLAVGFAASVVVIRPPTLRVAYHFALGTIGTGLVLGVVPGVVRERVASGSRRMGYRIGIVTALAAVTLALVGYLVAYLAVAG